MNNGYRLADGSMSTDYKIGDEFEVVTDGTFGVGSVIALYDDGKTYYPEFNLISGLCKFGDGRACIFWEKLKPTTKKKTVADAWDFFKGQLPYENGFKFDVIIYNQDTNLFRPWHRAFGHIDKVDKVEYGVCTFDEFEQFGRNRIWRDNNTAAAMCKKLHDPINPSHYKNHPSGVECIQITEHMEFNLGNALKYIWRCDLKKDSIEDLNKAIWYINREIEKRSPK